jgi:LuxR family transcriptional regulator, maltose regulon positive regulatory protein
MPVPILATKLYIPTNRPGIVQRPRLIERLNGGLAMGHKLTLISASAGFGKTTLVSEWINQHAIGGALPARAESNSVSFHSSFSITPPTKVAWVSLDEGDSDPVRFISYLVAALRTIRAGTGEELLAALESHQPPQIEAVLTALLNEISVFPEHFLLVLDDYHLIDSQAVDQWMTFLVEHQPPQFHLVIATREDPSLPLARLRARGQLIELRAADLRFTPTEAADFLNQMMGLNLSAENIAALEARTEGWIAGLQLAALSLQGRKDTAGFIQAFTGSHRFVLDYLVEEVLQHQPKYIRSFLLETVILDRFCAPLCNAVTEREDAREILDVLERSNLFLIPLDDQRLWYRYHHLFADVLQTHLRETQPHRITALHLRASTWYEQNGLRPDAIRQALAAGEFAYAADLIELVMPAMNLSRQFATLLGWLKALPDELVRLRPVLSTEYALASMSCGENDCVESRLRDAEQWLSTAPDIRKRPEALATGMVVVNEDEFRRVPGMIALIRAGQALARGDMLETVKNARMALDLAPKDDYLMLGGAASQLGLAAWTSGDLDAARQMTTDGMENVRRAGYLSPAIGGAITLADIQIAQGCLHEAMSTYERVLQWATERGAPAPAIQGTADMHVGMSNLYYEHNDLKTATQHLLTSQALGDLAGLPQNPYRWRTAMALIREAQGDLAGALELLDQAEQLYDGNFSPNVRPVTTRKVRVWLTQGRFGEALGWARERRLSVEDEIIYLHEYDHITLARVLLACHQSDYLDGSISGAVRLLEHLLKAAEEGGRRGSVIEILVLQAIAYHTQGDLSAALLPLQRALILAQPEGYVRMFVDEGSSIMQLLREASAREIMPDYTDKLLGAFEPEKRKRDAKTDLPPGQPLIEPLSQRELQILQLIAQGLSNREIGERLFLALDTVKGHNRKIFDKLQAQSRTEAVARARQLALL